ncbi:hypothetical protein QAD02_023839 [Eretmocerus hayati]|uniref:Uncharacterized protein n=1 Tax=Eretmocerus hayati TaxID=131215 RepID=A0ACC2PWP4_9HYME|nr:hypothetical protein QAD02_023839 [Eretmocerus hayati]
MEISKIDEDFFHQSPMRCMLLAGYLRLANGLRSHVIPWEAWETEDKENVLRIAFPSLVPEPRKPGQKIIKSNVNLAPARLIAKTLEGVDTLLLHPSIMCPLFTYVALLHG